LSTVDVVVMDVFDSTSKLCADLARALCSRGYNVNHLREASAKKATRYLVR
jgi:hypothetical protein